MGGVLDTKPYRIIADVTGDVTDVQAKYEYWKHTQLTVDVVKGRGSGFSVEAPEGVRFLIRSRVFTDQESAALGLL